MSKKNTKTFKYTPTYPLPKLKKVRTEWDLKKYYYSSEKDPQLEKDIVVDERAYTAFAKKYAGKNFIKNTPTLLAALKDYEKLSARSSATRAAYYFYYRIALDAKDSVAEKHLNLIEDRLTKASNKVIFFTLLLGKVSKKDQKKYLGDDRLAHYKYFLERIFIEAAHTLTEPEEKVISLYGGPAYGMWTAMTDKIINNRTVHFEGNELSLPEALESIESQTGTKKDKLWNTALDELEQISEVSEAEYNAIVTRKKISDELRGYTKPYSATVQSYENDERGVEGLIEAISTKGFALSKSFYKLNAKYLGKDKIDYIHKYDSIGKEEYIPFDQAVEVCRDAFYGIKKEYGEYFDDMLEGGNIDVYPKKGKGGGAFMSSNTGQPIFVFLNQTDTFKSLETLAHEMGHGLHSHRSKTQKPLYEQYTTTTAETASTLFEGIVFNKMLETATDAQKRTLLHGKITRDIATIQRQVAFFNFELEMHTTVRTNGAVTKEELNKMMQKHLRSYLGPAVHVTERDGLTHVFVGHFRRSFYVYSYAYGILMSNIMNQNLKTDPSYVSQIDTFLTLGGTKTVEEIFKTIGINAYKTETFMQSLSAHENDIALFKKLTK